MQRQQLWVYGGDPPKVREGVEMEALSNTPTVESTIVRVKVPSYRTWIFVPFPIFAKLYYTTGEEFDLKEKIRIFYRDGHSPEEFPIASFNYGARRVLAWEDQWTGGSPHDDEPRYWRALEPLLLLGRDHPRITQTEYGPGFVLYPGEFLDFRIETDLGVDWSNPNAKLLFEVLEEIQR